VVAAGRKRRVYFFEPVVRDQEDRVQAIAEDFWDDLHKHVEGLADRERTITFFGRDIAGQARTSQSPSARYFYLDRERPGQDWPDARGHDGVLDTLASRGDVRSLHEPAYLLGVSGSRYVAFVRTSGGPSTSAIERWLNLVMGFEETDDRVELRAYTRTDALERFARATAATKVRLAVEPNSLSEEDLTGELGQAIVHAQQVGRGGVSVDMTISFGRVRPDDEAGQTMIREVREVLNAPTTFRKARATVVLDGEDGETRREMIDFNRDRVTVSQVFGDDLDQEPRPEVVLTGLLEAIKTFRQNLR
jgi:hypothetical protein